MARLVEFVRQPWWMVVSVLAIGTSLSWIVLDGFGRGFPNPAGVIITATGKHINSIFGGLGPEAKATVRFARTPSCHVSHVNFGIRPDNPVSCIGCYMVYEETHCDDDWCVYNWYYADGASGDPYQGYYYGPPDPCGCYEEFPCGSGGYCNDVRGVALSRAQQMTRATARQAAVQ